MGLRPTTSMYWSAFIGEGVAPIRNPQQHGCCSRAPWIGSRHVYIGDYLGLHQRPSEVTREVVVPHQEPSTAWMLWQRPHGWVHAAPSTLPINSLGS